jgi:uncharacterized FlgJ-related protein
MYRYNKQTLTFEKVSMAKKNLLFTIITLSSVGIALTAHTSVRAYESIMNVDVTHNNFTEDRLIDKLKELNIRFPHIALAQAKIESSDFRSAIFKENNNLFGMKQARVRINTAIGTNRSHAEYATWEDSVIDYALWCATYANQCKTEEQFYNLLSEYAEAGHYEEALRNIIEKQNLKEKF